MRILLPKIPIIPATLLLALPGFILASPPAKADIILSTDGNGFSHFSASGTTGSPGFSDGTAMSTGNSFTPLPKLDVVPRIAEKEGKVRHPAGTMASRWNGVRPQRLAAATRKAPVLARHRRLYQTLATRAAAAHGLDSRLVQAVITVESGHNPRAISPKGAVGLMQLLPGTARQYGVTDLFDPVQNVNGGARYLKHLLQTFNGDVRLALAAYNAGEGNVMRFGKSIPPFRETRNYVMSVLSIYGQSSHR